jgi:hypothetical protein
VLALQGTITDTRPCAAGLVLVNQDFASHASVSDLNAVRMVGPGQTPFSFTVEEITPDVLALRPSTPLAPGRYVLRGVSSDPITVELIDTPLPPLAAPAVVRPRRNRRTERGGLDRTYESASLTLELSNGAPTHAIAIAEWTQEGESVRTWGLISATAPRPTAILASIGRCSGHGRFPPAGARVSVRVLDLNAQLSPPSRVLRAPR